MFTVDPTPHVGARQSATDPVELACYRFLDSLSIDYIRADHDPADTIEDCKAIEPVISCPICKNLVLTTRNKKRAYLLLLPGDKPFHTRFLSAQIASSRLSFVTPEHMESLLRVRPGSATPLSLINDPDQTVSLLIDRELLSLPYLGFHPCRNTSTVRLPVNDLLTIFLPALGRSYTAVDLPWDVEGT